MTQQPEPPGDSQQPVVSCLVRNGRISFVSPTSVDVSGLPPERFHGRLVWDLVHPDDQSLISRFLAVGWTGEIDVAVRIQDHDQAWTWRLVRGAREIDPSGQPSATLTLQKLEFPPTAP